MVILILLPLAVAALPVTNSKTVNTDEASVQSLLDSLPKECSKNGKTFKEGETFEFGRLRYKCQKYGVYSIEGCKTEKGVELKRGESRLVENIFYQCLTVGSSVYFRETVCGVAGSPDCDKVPQPQGFLDAMKNETKEPHGISHAGLPEGWKLLDEGHRPIPGTNATIITRTLVFSGISEGRRVRRQSGHGVGSVIGIEDVGTDKPPMPMEMLMGGRTTHHSATTPKTPSHRKNVVSTQTVGATLNTGRKGSQRTVGTGTGNVDLNKRTQISGNTAGLRPDSISGWRSDVKWQGKTINVNGKSIAADEGTFTFGNRPTGAVHLKKDN